MGVLGVTVSEILGGVLMTVISKLEFRKVYNRIKDESSESSS